MTERVRHGQKSAISHYFLGEVDHPRESLSQLEKAPVYGMCDIQSITGHSQRITGPDSTAASRHSPEVTKQRSSQRDTILQWLLSYPDAMPCCSLSFVPAMPSTLQRRNLTAAMFAIFMQRSSSCLVSVRCTPTARVFPHDVKFEAECIADVRCCQNSNAQRGSP